MKPLVVIPTYNESENIHRMLEQVLGNLKNCDILVVDDGSPDGTADIVKKHSDFGTRVHLLLRRGKEGLGKAYIAGFDWAMRHPNAQYHAVVQMDADFSHSPRALPYLVGKLEQNDGVVGSRYVEGGGTENWGAMRLLISKLGSSYARMILGTRIKDMTGGFNAWRVETLRAVDVTSIKSEGYCFQIELKYRAQQAGLRLTEHPIQFSERRAGQSKMSMGIIFEAIFKVWKLRLGSPKS